MKKYYVLFGVSVAALIVLYAAQGVALVILQKLFVLLAGVATGMMIKYAMNGRRM